MPAPLVPINPFTGRPAGEYAVCDSSEAEKLFGRAWHAYGNWSRIPLLQRVEALREALSYFRDNRQAIAKDITSQMGKPIRQAMNEIDGMLLRARYLCDIAAEALAPEVLPSEGGLLRRIEHVPLGPVLIISAWNYPLLVSINGVAASLLAGNTVVLKHSPVTPAVGMHFKKAFGSLAGQSELVQNLVAEPAVIDGLIRASLPAHVIFTGSERAGRAVQRALGETLLGGQLELGAKDAAYVAEDADIEAAAASLVDGAMYNAGQSCCAIERAYVHEKVYDRFLAACRPHVQAYVLGDPMDETTTMGPLALPHTGEFMRSQVEEAVKAGARLLEGGGMRRIGQGLFFEPTLIHQVPQQVGLMQQETFGPILPVQSVSGDEEALSRINDSPYGLTAALYTSSLERAERLAPRIEAGTVYMNRCDVLDPALPWTGCKQSGRGSTLSRYGFHSVTRRKAIHFRPPEL